MQTFFQAHSKKSIHFKARIHTHLNTKKAAYKISRYQDRSAQKESPRRDAEKRDT